MPPPCDAAMQHLRIEDIDSKRMVLHVREGKGRIPRDIALSPVLLERLRIYFRQYRPKEWLFPSRQNHGSMMEDRSLRYVCRQAAKRAGIKRRVHPHLFRHACTTKFLFLCVARLFSCRVGELIQLIEAGPGGR
jgi:integrase/recombinase XerD